MNPINSSSLFTKQNYTIRKGNNETLDFQKSSFQNQDSKRNMASLSKNSNNSNKSVIIQLQGSNKEEFISNKHQMIDNESKLYLRQNNHYIVNKQKGEDIEIQNRFISSSIQRYNSYNGSQIEIYNPEKKSEIERENQLNSQNGSFVGVMNQSKISSVKERDHSQNNGSIIEIMNPFQIFQIEEDNSQNESFIEIMNPSQISQIQRINPQKIPEIKRENRLNSLNGSFVRMINPFQNPLIEEDNSQSGSFTEIMNPPLNSSYVQRVGRRQQRPFPPFPHRGRQVQDTASEQARGPVQRPSPFQRNLLKSPQIEEDNSLNGSFVKIINPAKVYQGEREQQENGSYLEAHNPSKISQIERNNLLNSSYVQRNLLKSLTSVERIFAEKNISSIYTGILQQIDEQDEDKINNCAEEYFFNEREGEIIADPEYEEMQNLQSDFQEQYENHQLDVTIQVDFSFLERMNMWNQILIDNMPYNPPLRSVDSGQQKIEIVITQNADVLKETKENILLQTSNQILEKEWSIDLFNDLNKEFKLEKMIGKTNQILKELVDQDCYLLKYLAEGGEGYIFEGYIKQKDKTQVEVAFKIIFNTNEAEIRDEISIMNRFELNINVIQFYGVHKISEKIWVLVLEKCQHSLFNELKMIQEVKKVFPIIQFFKIIFDLLDGLIQFKIYNILHLDIKPGNILVTNDGNCVYTDFGLSQLKQKGKQVRSKGWTPSYAPIEQTNEDLNQNIEFNSDIYSLGKTIEWIVHIFCKINRDNTISQFFKQEIVRKMVLDDINEREKCEDLHKKIILNLLFGKLKDYSYILQYYMKKLDIILKLYKYDANKNIPYILDIELYYNQIYLEIYQYKIINDKSSKNKKVGFKSQLPQIETQQSLPQVASQITLSSNVEVEKALCNQLEQIKQRKQLFNLQNLKTLSYLIKNVGESYKNIGKFGSALQYGKYSYEIIKEALLGNHPEIALSLNNVGLCYLNIGDFENALVYCQQSLNMSRALFKIIHPKIVISLNNVGTCLQNLGQYELALIHYMQSLSIQKQVFKENQSKKDFMQQRQIQQELLNRDKCKIQGLVYSLIYDRIIHSINFLNVSYKHLKNINISQRESVSQDIPQIAILLNNIGTCYYQMGEYFNGIDHIEKSIDMLRILLQSNHPLIATALANLGQCRLKRNDYYSALSEYQKSLKIRKQIFDQNNSEIASSLNYVGICQSYLGDDQTALRYFFESVKISSTILDKDYIMLVDNEKRNLEDSDIILKSYEKYYQFNEQFKNKFGLYKLKLNQIEIQEENDTFVGMYAIKMDVCDLETGWSQQTKPINQSSLKFKKQFSTINQHNLSVSFFNIGQCFIKTGNVNMALSYHFRSLQIREEIYEGNHYYTAQSLNQIGLCYLQERDYTNSIIYIQKSLTMFRDIFEGNNYQVAISLYHIGYCYLKLIPRNALRYLKKSLKMFENILDSQNYYREIFNCLKYIAKCYSIMGDLQTALNFYHQSLETIQREYGDNLNYVEFERIKSEIVKTIKKIVNFSFTCLNKKNSIQDFEISKELLNIYHVKMFDYFHQFEISFLDRTSLAADSVLQYLMNTLNIRKKMYTRNHVSIATSLFNIGEYYGKIKKFDKALCYHLEALYMRMQILDRDHLDVATSRNHVGRCYLYTKDSFFALFYNEKNLNQFSEDPLIRSSNILTLNNIGMFYELNKNFEKALEYHLQSLDLCYEMNIINHPETIDTLLNVGNCYLKLSNWHEGINYFDQANKICWILYGTQNLITAESEFNIGLCYQSIGYPEYAQISYNNFLTMYYTIKNKYDAPCYFILTRIGEYQQDQGMYESAIWTHKHNLQVMYKECKTIHLEMVIQLVNIVFCYNQIGQHRIALKYSIEILEMVIAFYKINKVQIVESLLRVAECYQNIGEYQIALNYYFDSLEMNKLLRNNSNPEQALDAEFNFIVIFYTRYIKYVDHCYFILTRIGECYQNLGMYESAIWAHKYNLEIMKEECNTNSSEIGVLLDHLIFCYYQIGQHQIALKYRLNLIKLIKLKQLHLQ